MTERSPPPVPERLREMLKDYPGHIALLQEALDSTITKPSIATPPFEFAIWALEGRLETFMMDATTERRAAEASGDPIAIESAKAKERLMFRARSSNGGMRLGLMDDLWSYFGKHKEGLE